MKKQKISKGLLAILILSIISFLVPFFLYFQIFNNGISVDDQNWANFGSFIGGLGATIFSFSSFIALLFTIYSEKEKNQQTEIEKVTEKEEKRFFQYLDYLLTCREKLYCITNKETINGPSVINFYNAQITFLYSRRNILKQKYNDNINDFKKREESTDGYIFLYAIANDATESFNNLCTQITNYIMNSKYINKMDFIRLFISQLSNQDKMLLHFKNENIVKIIEDRNIELIKEETKTNFKQIAIDAYDFIEIIK